MCLEDLAERMVPHKRYYAGMYIGGDVSLCNVTWDVTTRLWILPSSTMITWGLLKEQILRHISRQLMQDLTITRRFKTTGQRSRPRGYPCDLHTYMVGTVPNLGCLDDTKSIMYDINTAMVISILVSKMAQDCIWRLYWMVVKLKGNLILVAGRNLHVKYIDYNYLCNLMQNSQILDQDTPLQANAYTVDQRFHRHRGLLYMMFNILFGICIVNIINQIYNLWWILTKTSVPTNMYAYIIFEYFMTYRWVRARKM